MSNKKSVDAKAYINAKVDDMRKAFKWADKSEKQALIDTFRADVSSPEYQENLKIVHDDSKVIREKLQIEKWRSITSEEFQTAKTKFYGQNMNLGKYDKDFESWDTYRKIEYLFDKYWNGDKTLWLVLDMADKWWWRDYLFQTYIHFRDSDIEERLFKTSKQYFENLSLPSAKKLADYIPFAFLLFTHPNSFKEWVYNDNEIIKSIVKHRFGKDFNTYRYLIGEDNLKLLLSKMTSDSQKKLVSHIAWYGGKWARRLMSNFIYLDLWKDVDVFNYIIAQIIKKRDEKTLLEIIKEHSKILSSCGFRKENYDNYDHEKKFSNALINTWKGALLKENIAYFNHLSEKEKTNILEVSEEEYAKYGSPEKFYRYEIIEMLKDGKWNYVLQHPELSAYDIPHKIDKALQMLVHEYSSYLKDNAWYAKVTYDNTEEYPRIELEFPQLFLRDVYWNRWWWKNYSDRYYWNPIERWNNFILSLVQKIKEEYWVDLKKEGFIFSKARLYKNSEYQPDVWHMDYYLHFDEQTWLTNLLVNC